MPDSSLYGPAPGVTYLNTASYGLPPATAISALRRAQERWADGTADWVEEWDREGEACRVLAARLLHVDAGDIGLVPAVSIASALAATLVPEGGEVLVADEEFASVAWPFAVLAGRGRVKLRSCPLARLADEISPRTALVAVSHVQSLDGALADIPAIVDRARAAGARVYLDVTHSLGVVPCETSAHGADIAACAAYKWLSCPRGTGFLYVAPELRDRVLPLTASWRGAADPYGGFYGVEPVLAGTAARFDVSLAWHAWVGARPSLEALLSVPDAERFERAHGLASHIARGLGLPEPGSSIVSVPVAEGASAALLAAGIRASASPGRIRLSPHFYNSRDDAERAIAALAPHARARRG